MKLIRPFVLLMAVCTALVYAQPAGSPVATYGQLKVTGNKIKDKNNNDVQLRGMSFFWGSVSWEGNMYWNADVLNWLVADWSVQVVRIPLGAYDKEFLWAGTAIAQRRAAETLIDAAIAKGVYVILDWHAHSLGSGSKDSAKVVFRDFAQKYGNTPNIIYEIYNEPINDSWSTIRSYANEIIPIIRQRDPDNIILVGTPFYSQRLNEVVGNTVSGTNIGYVLHFYAMSHGGDLQNNAQALLNANQMVYVTEWGTTGADGGADGQWSQSSSDSWISWMDARKIGWCNWSITHKVEASAVIANTTASDKRYFGGWTSAELSASGRYIRCKLRTIAGRNCNFDTPTSSSSTTVSSSSAEAGPGDLQIIPGRLEPEQWSMALGVRYGNGTSDETDTMAVKRTLSYIENGDWAEYNVYVSQTATYQITTRTAGTNGMTGSARILIDGTQVGTFNILPSGYSTIWLTSTNIASVPLTVGNHVLRLNFSSTASSVPNISWIELKAPGVIPNAILPNRMLGQVHWRAGSDGAVVLDNPTKRTMLLQVTNVLGAVISRHRIKPGVNHLTLDAGLGSHILSLMDGANRITSQVVNLSE